MVKKKKRGLLFVGIIVISATSIAIFMGLNSELPDVLPSGQDPSLMLPLVDFTFNDFIGGFGQITPEFYHNGIDFGINDTTIIVAACDAYVSYVHLNWYNEKGGHWQSNVNLRLNKHWTISMPFESWTTDESLGQLQANEINVETGQYIKKGDVIGNLLCHGESAHLHFGLIYNDLEVCPYQYFNETAQLIFEIRYVAVGYPTNWCN